MAQQPEEEEIFGTETLWRSIANYMYRLEKYNKSLKYYDLAVIETPNDKKTLIDRARARARCNNYLGALEDIANALKIDPLDLIALAEKAHTTFLNTHFEEALIQNQRLLPRRKKPDYFFLGALKCIATLEQCVGDVAGTPLRDHFLIIRRLAWKWNMDSIKEISFVPRGKEKQKKKKKVKKPDRRRTTLMPEEHLRVRDRLYSQKSETFVIPPFRTEVKFAPLQNYTTNIANYMAEKYLDRMYREKVFLKTMVDHRGLTIPNAAGSKRLKQIAIETYDGVAKKQEVLRTSRPFYFLKYQEAKITGKLKSRQETDLLLYQQNVKKETDKQFLKLETAFKEKQLPSIIELSEKLYRFCQLKPKRLLPDKDMYIKRILDIVRRGFYDLYRLNPDQAKWDQEKRILVCLDQPISREPSNDSVIKQFTYNVFDYYDMVKFYEDRMQRAEYTDEICWSYHELARYSMLSKNYENARIYAKKCLIDIADLEEMEEWYLNLTMIVLRTNMREKNKFDAMAEARNAMQLAEKRKDRQLREYIKRMTTVISEIEFEEAEQYKVEERRQKKIMQLMANEKLRVELKGLLQQMGPRKMTGSRGSKDATASTTKLGKDKGKSMVDIDAPEGAGFMQLIQFHI
ncbi:unnamed protein product [Phyllotreta striolata]|uniref:Tetratricopeptide repeat protein 25 n=1 Tax=Phyllotreta striolata TaxID=444603 RepID=A0A9N9XJC8_PHYSR|nr:unnamed protein product [Phyllotreta striolata]